jgi:hypothetical protein
VKEMQKMKESSIRNVLGCLAVMLLVASCGTKPVPIAEVVEPVETIVVRNVPVEKPKPIVPTVDQLKLRDVTWIVVTPDNVEQKMQEIKNKGGDPVIFGLTSTGYENLSLNLSDVRANIEQYKRVIAIYERSYN